MNDFVFIENEARIIVSENHQEYLYIFELIDEIYVLKYKIAL